MDEPEFIGGGAVANHFVDIPETLGGGPVATHTVRALRRGIKLLQFDAENNPTGAIPKPSVSDGVVQLSPTLLQRIGTLEDVNLSATGTTAIFTAPTGFDVIVTRVEIIAVAAGNTSDPSVSIDVSTPGDLFANTLLTALQTTGEAWNFVSSGKTKVVTAGSTVSINVHTAANNTLLADVHVFGYLVPPVGSPA
jgi:hypothetical protein